jgi:hypothetical protein
VNVSTRRGISKRTAWLGVITISVLWFLNGLVLGSYQSPMRDATPAPGICPTNAELLEILKTDYWFQYGNQVTDVKTGYGAYVCQKGLATIDLTAIMGPRKQISYLVVLHYWNEKRRWTVSSTKWQETVTIGPDTLEV